MGGSLWNTGTRMCFSWIPITRNISDVDVIKNKML